MDFVLFAIPLIMFGAAFFNGVVMQFILPKKFPKEFAGWVTTLAMASTFLLAVAGILIPALAGGANWPGMDLKVWNWMTLGDNFSIDMAFRADQLTAVFVTFISFIGSLVFLYAIDYMKEHHHGKLELDPGYVRFFAYLALFAASMYMLVLGANLAVMFIGWEGVGLSSYLLIGYYFKKPFSETLSCADAGRKAFVMNRIGDAGLIVGMGLIFWGLGTMDFAEIANAITSGTRPDGQAIPAGFLFGGMAVTGATLALLLGATGKSAQIPLFTWLPDAMAGPTPVSALIHAATMVTAGIYMIARLNTLFFMAPITMNTIAVVGALTAFVAAVAGCTQRGIKKALAYSTVSQLGFMFLALGVGSMAAGVFHVFTHAFFKGCLFLCAGSVIHALHHEEDMFKMGGLRKYMPQTHAAYFIATLAIAGIFPFAGFFSKDEILWMTYSRANGEGMMLLLWLLGTTTAFLTAFYMGRTYFLTFRGKERLTPEAKKHVHEVSPKMTIPVLVLAGMSIVVGFLNMPPGLVKAVGLYDALGSKTAAFHHFLAPVVDRGAEYVSAEGFISGAHGAHGAEHGAAHAEGHGHGVIGPLVLAGAEDTEENVQLEATLALISLIIAALGLLLSWALYGSRLPKNLAKGLLKPFWKLSYNAWGIDGFYNKFFRDGAMWKARMVADFDAKIIDGAVVNTGRFARDAGHSVRSVQDGQVQRYGIVMVFGLVIFLAWLIVGLGLFDDRVPSVIPAERSQSRAIQPAPAQPAAESPEGLALAE